MISRTDCRLGNFFRDRNSGAILKVEHLSTSLSPNIGFLVIDRKNYPLAEDWQAEPIPITPEILEKAGFEYEGQTTLTKEGFPIYFKLIKDHKPQAHCFYLNGQITIMVAYVHELQNIYYFFFREELNIEL